ncbi:MAG TPA: DUF5681 domain-containing protein [Rickettsiales bacterium]|nr:DUF5681 domain-containing protein [Rickettsiales bacterium]
MPKEYNIGYGKPPATTRFKPGRSGNPKGRKKGVKNFASVFQEELEAYITITENGERKAIPKKLAIIKQLINKALSGDPKSIAMLVNIYRQNDNHQSDTRAASMEELLEEDQKILKHHRRGRENHDAI